MEKVQELVASQYVDLSDVVHLLAEEIGWSDGDVKRELLALRFDELQPQWISDPPDFFATTSPHVEWVQYHLGAIPPQMLSQSELEDFSRYEVCWSIPDLVAWCKTRKISTPKAWKSWMSKEYLALRKRDLIPLVNASATETTEERRERIWTWYQEECQTRGKRGAPVRVAEREGVTRQMIDKILNKSAKYRVEKGLTKG